MEKLLAWRNFMIGIFIWITTWEVWSGIVRSSKFGKKYYVSICFIILVALTWYVFNSDTISWSGI